jgi:hypothetical protein
MDLEKMRGSNVFAKIKDTVGEQGDSLFMIYQMGLLKGGEGAKVTGDDVKSMIMAGNLMSGNFSDLVIGLQLKKDFPISDMTAGMQVTAKKHNDTEYYEAVSGQSTTYVCRLDAALYCVSRSEALLKGAVDRFKSGKPAELGEDMASALASVHARDTFAVMSAPGIKCMAVGVNVNGSLDAKMVMVMDNKGQAQEMVDGVEKAIETAEKAAPPAGATDIQKQAMEVQKEMMSSMDVDRSGSSVIIRYGLKTETILRLLDHPQFKQQVAGMLSGIPSVGPGLPMQPQK